MICSKCQTDNNAQSQFCEGCGQSLIAVSPPPLAANPSPSTTGPSGEEYLPGEAPSSRIAAGNAGVGDDATGGQGAIIGLPIPTNCVTCNGPVEETYCTVCGAKQPDPRDHFEIVHSPGFAGVCDRGIQHAANQDSMSIAPGLSADQAALVVCDGVTTAPLSERAALAATAAACDSLANAFSAQPASRTPDYWSEALKVSCTAAQAQAVAVSRTLGDPPEPPSCTFVASVVDGAMVHTGWCGDSRAYWLPDVGAGIVLSVDDSIASQLIASGMSRVEAESDPRAHTITRWLGADSPDPTAKTASIPISEPGWVAVVSDGMWNYATEPEMLRAQMVQGDALVNAKAMVKYANDCGGVDNITVTLFRIGPVPVAPESTPVATVPIDSPTPDSVLAEPDPVLEVTDPAVPTP
jgi:serine/threonine protein phosphatase PrpC